jgi:hypothetical protein
VLELLFPDGRPALCVYERASAHTLAAVRIYR